MTTRFAALCAAMTLAACIRQEPHVACFKLDSLNELSQAEKKALAHTKKDSESDCKQTDVQCAFKVFKSKDGKIVVGTSHAIVQDGRCVWPIGDTGTDVYDANGNFLSTVPGL